MTYFLNPAVKLHKRSVRGYGTINFITRDGVGDQPLVIDDRALPIIEKLILGKPYFPSDSDREILSRLEEDGVVSRDDAKENWHQPSAESLQFWVQTSDRCNLACTYCYIPSLNSNRTRRHDLFSLFGKKLLAVRGLRTISIKLAGGEPLLSFKDWSGDVIKLKLTLADAGIDLNVRIITNLTFLNKEIVEYIKENNFGISVSIDGLATYNDKSRIFPTRDRGSFQVVMKNLEILRTNGIKPAVMVTATSENAHGMAELVEWLVYNDLVFRISDAKGGYIRPDEFENSFVEVDKILSAPSRVGYPVSDRMVVSDLRTLSPQATPCSMGVSGGALYLDGSIYFCHTEFNEGTPLGTIDEDENLVTIIRRGYSRHLGLSSECKACEYRFICAGGCPLYRVNGKSPMCSAYKRIIPKIFDLYENKGQNV